MSNVRIEKINLYDIDLNYGSSDDEDVISVTENSQPKITTMLIRKSPEPAKTSDEIISNEEINKSEEEHSNPDDIESQNEEDSEKIEGEDSQNEVDSKADDIESQTEREDSESCEIDSKNDENVGQNEEEGKSEEKGSQNARDSTAEENDSQNEGENSKNDEIDSKIEEEDENDAKSDEFEEKSSSNDENDNNDENSQNEGTNSEINSTKPVTFTCNEEITNSDDNSSSSDRESTSTDENQSETENAASDSSPEVDSVVSSRTRSAAAKSRASTITSPQAEVTMKKPLINLKTPEIILKRVDVHLKNSTVMSKSPKIVIWPSTFDPETASTEVVHPPKKIRLMLPEVPFMPIHMPFTPVKIAPKPANVAEKTVKIPANPVKIGPVMTVIKSFMPPVPRMPSEPLIYGNTIPKMIIYPEAPNLQSFGQVSFQISEIPSDVTSNISSATFNTAAVPETSNLQSFEQVSFQISEVPSDKTANISSATLNTAVDSEASFRMLPPKNIRTYTKISPKISTVTSIADPEVSSFQSLGRVSLKISDITSNNSSAILIPKISTVTSIAGPKVSQPENSPKLTSKITSAIIDPSTSLESELTIKEEAMDIDEQPVISQVWQDIDMDMFVKQETELECPPENLLENEPETAPQLSVPAGNLLDEKLGVFYEGTNESFSKLEAIQPVLNNDDLDSDEPATRRQVACKSTAKTVVSYTEKKAPKLQHFMKVCKVNGSKIAIQNGNETIKIGNKVYKIIGRSKNVDKKEKPLQLASFGEFLPVKIKQEKDDTDDGAIVSTKVVNLPTKVTVKPLMTSFKASQFQQRISMADLDSMKKNRAVTSTTIVTKPIQNLKYVIKSPAGVKVETTSLQTANISSAKSEATTTVKFPKTNTKIVVNKQNPIYRCQKCHLLFSSQTEYTDHVEEHKTGIVYNQKRVIKLEELQKLNQYQCQQCSAGFASIEKLSAHENRHKTEFTCKYCDMKFLLLYRYREHMQMHDIKKDKLIECKVCLQRFRKLIRYEEHMLTHVPKGNFPCTGCALIYSTQDQLIEHQKSGHLKRNTLKCGLCNYETFVKQNFEKHANMHMRYVEKIQTNTFFKCDECPQSFREKGVLMEHKNGVHGK